VLRHTRQWATGRGALQAVRRMLLCDSPTRYLSVLLAAVPGLHGFCDMLCTAPVTCSARLL
jgi:hypothetical protein